MDIPYAEVIGDPIAHSKSPIIHKFWLEKLGLDGDYRPLLVRAGELVHYLELRRRDPDWRGCNATMPLKGELHRLLARQVEGEGDRSGSFNCAVPIALDIPQDAMPLDLALVGANTDHLGIVEPLIHHARIEGPLVVIGSGGAARTAVYGLSNSQFTETVIVTRNPHAARQMLEALGLPGSVQGLAEPLPPAALLINTSPLGMRGFPEPNLDLAPLPTGAILYDLVYDPVETTLVRAARARGLAVIDGLTMLVGQARRSFQLFFKRIPPTEHDSALRELLAR